MFVRLTKCQYLCMKLRIKRKYRTKKLSKQTLMKKFYVTLAAALLATATFAQKSLVQKQGAPQFLQTAQLHGTPTNMKAPALTGHGLELQQQAQQTFAARHAAAKAPATAAATDDHGIITEQPEGTLYKNLYGYHYGFYVFYYYVYASKEDGMVDEVVFADDGSVYLKNPFSTLNTNSWLKGTLADDGETINVALPQPIYYQEDEETSILFYAWKCKRERVSDPDYGEYDYYVADSVDNNVKFTWKDGTLRYEGEDDAIIGLTDADKKWYGYGDAVKIMSVYDKAPSVPSASATVEDYVLTHVIDDFNPDSIATDKQIVKLYKDGDDIYLNELGGKDDGVYVKATGNGSTYSVSDSQYLGVPEDSKYHLFTKTLGWKQTDYVDWYGETVTYDSTYFAGNDYAFTYDAATKTYTGENRYLSINYSDTTFYTAVSFKQPVLTPYVKVEAAPTAPTISAAEDYGSEGYTYGYITFDLSNEDKDGNFLNPNNIYYNILLDVEGDEQVYTFYSDNYYYQTIDEMTEVPYTYYDSYDLYADNNTRKIYVYTTGYDKIGVQEYYLADDGTKYYSDKVWYDLTGIQNVTVADQAQKVSTVSYFDLSGRQVVKPQHGVFIQNVTYSDGSNKAQKVVIK